MVVFSAGRYLSFPEREGIAVLKAQGAGVKEIARRLGRDPSTISRELRRNAATRGGKPDYRASVAQWKAELLAQRPKTARLVVDERLREYVQRVHRCCVADCPMVRRRARRPLPPSGGISPIGRSCRSCRVCCRAERCKDEP